MKTKINIFQTETSIIEGGFVLEAPQDNKKGADTMTTRKELYPVTVTFDRTFKNGALKGMTIKDSVDFISFESARTWITAVSNHKGFDTKLHNFFIA